MEIVLTRMVGLLLIAILVAIVARRLRLPYTVGLVVTGIVLAMAKVKTGAELTHDLIFDAILPPLLFEAALSMHWRELRRDLIPVLVLSFLGVLVSAAVVAIGLMRFLNWPVAPAIIFGALIAATDPVAVIAMFKDAGVKGRLRLLVESESLFNDGVAAFVFSLALDWTQAPDSATPAAAAWSLATMAGGGVAIGLAVAAAAIVLAGRTFDYLVETALTVVVAYGSFLLAEHFHFSGVLAVVTAGLLMGNLGALAEEHRWQPISAQGHAFILAYWDFMAFIVNSFIFLLIGLAVENIPFSEVGVSGLAITTGLVLAARLLTVYPLCALFRRTGWAIPMAKQHVLWWGGLRGALALALALSLPPSLPLRDEILIAAFGVVVFSVLAQGLTMPLLMKKLGFLPISENGKA